MLKLFLHREVDAMQLNEAVSRRLLELLRERDMTQYQLNMKSGVPKTPLSVVPSTLRPIPTAISSSKVISPGRPFFLTVFNFINPCQN